MTIKEAVKYFESDILKADNKKKTEAYDLAIEALEMQIPKKTIDICTPVITWGVCPSCKGELCRLRKERNRVFKSNKYCPDCGQALKWKEG